MKTGFDTAEIAAVKVLLFATLCVSAYAMWWLAKNGSYFLWYESMVQETIREMVKPEFLK